MLKTVLALAVVVGISGCAVSQQSPTVELTEPTPICTNDRQCEAMWVKAVDAIEMATGMRVRSQTDFMIDTFVPVNQPRMYGRVTKKPVQPKGYAIEADMQCRTASLCARLRNPGMNLFNLMVTSAGSSFGDEAK